MEASLSHATSVSKLAVRREWCISEIRAPRSLLRPPDHYPAIFAQSLKSTRVTFPIGNPAKNTQPTREEVEWLKAFPRPWRLVAVGGPARNWELDHNALASAIRTI